MFTQDLVDYLNRWGTGQKEKWLESNPSFHDFITCPRVFVRPSLFGEALRISVTENQYGRYVTILKRIGQRHYIFQIRNQTVSVEVIERLIRSIESKGGSCRVENMYLVIELPLGYLLDISDENLSQIILHQDQIDSIRIG